MGLGPCEKIDPIKRFLIPGILINDLTATLRIIAFPSMAFKRRNRFLNRKYPPTEINRIEIILDMFIPPVHSLRIIYRNYPPQISLVIIRVRYLSIYIFKINIPINNEMKPDMKLTTSLSKSELPFIRVVFLPQ